MCINILGCETETRFRTYKCEVASHYACIAYNSFTVTAIL